MSSRNSVNMPLLALKDLCGRAGRFVSTCHMQAKTDIAIGSILEANAMQVLHDAQEDVPSKEEQVIGIEGPFCDCLYHVTEDGYVSSKAEGSV